MASMSLETAIRGAGVAGGAAAAVARPPVRLAGHRVRALRHGMAGQPGFELFGPWAEGDDVLGAILAAGAEFGLVRAGAKAYSTANGSRSGRSLSRT